MAHIPQVLTRHGAKQTQSRCIPPVYIDILQDFGEQRPAGHGCTSFSMDKRAWRKLQAHYGPTAKAIQKVMNAYIVIGSDGALITAAWRH